MPNIKRYYPYEDDENEKWYQQNLHNFAAIRESRKRDELLKINDSSNNEIIKNNDIENNDSDFKDNRTIAEKNDYINYLKNGFSDFAILTLCVHNSIIEMKKTGPGLCPTPITQLNFNTSISHIIVSSRIEIFKRLLYIIVIFDTNNITTLESFKLYENAIFYKLFADIKSASNFYNFLNHHDVVRQYVYCSLCHKVKKLYKQGKKSNCNCV